MEYKTVIAIWKVNDLPHRLHELKLFLTMHDVDILLLSETHLTTKHHIKIPKYAIFKSPIRPMCTWRHSNNNKNQIKHHLHNTTVHPYLQATCVSAKIENRIINFAAVYNPPKFKITRNQIKHFFISLGKNF